jgi:hypothetical protein
MFDQVGDQGSAKDVKIKRRNMKTIAPIDVESSLLFVCLYFYFYFRIAKERTEQDRTGCGQDKYNCANHIYLIRLT